ncbi:hypothetical protein CYJ28_06890 [Aerococcus sanguinicola]|uniref:Uncharacterized protein n=1 Tax=Aerococcus sanguinicola TaxID=119206 RepID=A0A0X8FA99_9LACT|nr:hypothetical protein AWM72_02205 [Aerococcus sanguinicola]OFT95291.1 hypothetical protein HMPREF3090_04650 [Aerococcus sp. HMSC23C02]PKZ21623.1 hypothetical protein CYJ28_06890 [Aerococcus sanguinicola]
MRILLILTSLFIIQFLLNKLALHLSFGSNTKNSQQIKYCSRFYMIWLLSLILFIIIDQYLLPIALFGWIIPKYLKSISFDLEDLYVFITVYIITFVPQYVFIKQIIRNTFLLNHTHQFLTIIISSISIIILLLIPYFIIVPLLAIALYGVA